MLTLIEAAVFSILLIITIFYFFKPVYQIIRVVRIGQSEKRFDNIFLRIADAVTSFFLLFCSVKSERPITGFFHFFLLYGSLTFDTITVFHILEGFNKKIHISPVHSMIADIFSVGVIIAVVFLLIKRYVVRSSSYTYGTAESPIIYTLLVSVTLTFLLYEGAFISYHPGSENLAFLGRIISGWITPSYSLLKIFWWLHIVNVFAFILYVPRSKYMHMFMGPVNIMLKSKKSSGYIKPMDIENSERFGIQTLSDMTWKDLLDGFACIDCGRCTDYCPAAISGKPLSPKTIITKMRDSLKKEGAKKIRQNSFELTALMGNVYEDEEIWSCTTCGACMSVCPVKNEHIPKIIGLRQSRVLMEAKFPSELNPFFKNMENNSNPWGFGASTRAEWVEDKDVKTLAENPDAEYLLWVGCAGSFDDRNKKVTDAMVKILNRSGVSFAVLGNEEKCCGDPVRRAGNEYLFQMMARENLETLKRYGVKKIITMCPHGFNIFTNEYPEVSKLLLNEEFNVEIIHHSDFISKLLDSGKLNIKKDEKESFTYHDPCYLVRHNNMFRETRSVLKKSGGDIIEMKHNKKHSLCCGGGGALMWTEETIGDRINHIRTDEAIDTGASVLCTSCPYCTIMLSDGVKDKGKEDLLKVKDIAEIVAERII